MSGSAMPPAVLLGKSAGFLQESLRVYRCPDHLEVAQIDGYLSESRRVFFDDIQLVTLHRRRSRLGLWFSGINLGGTVVICALGIWASVSNQEGILIAALLSLFLGILPSVALLLIFVRPYVVITVFGVRSRAVMSFHWRHSKAQAIHDDLVEVIATHQATRLATAPMTDTGIPLPETEVGPPG